MMLRGVVVEIDAGRAAVKVRYPEYDLVSGWLPVVLPLAAGARVFALPRVGSQVVVLADRDLDDAVVVGCIYSQADPPPAAGARVLIVETEDGTKVTIDPDASLVTVDTPGSVQASAAGNISAHAGGDLDAIAGGSIMAQAPSITLKGDITLDGPVSATQIVQVAGPLCANAGITTSSGAAVPGTLAIAGTVHSESELTAPAATIGGKDFISHTHPTYGPGAPTGPVS